MELAKAEPFLNRTEARISGQIIELSQNKKLSKLEKRYGHLSPQELMDADITDRKKRIISGIQVVAMQSLTQLGLSEPTDIVELAAWEECHTRASGNSLVDERFI